MHSATLLQDGRVLVAGGIPNNWSYSFQRSFSDAGMMSAPREYHTATLLNDGRVLLAGGIYRALDIFAWATNTLEMYGP